MEEELACASLYVGHACELVEKRIFQAVLDDLCCRGVEMEGVGIVVPLILVGR